MACRGYGCQNSGQEYDTTTGHCTAEGQPITPPHVDEGTQGHSDGHDNDNQEQRPCYAHDRCQRTGSLANRDGRQRNTPEGNAPAGELGDGERSDQTSPAPAP